MMIHHLPHTANPLQNQLAVRVLSTSGEPQQRSEFQKPSVIYNAALQVTEAVWLAVFDSHYKCDKRHQLSSRTYRPDRLVTRC